MLQNLLQDGDRLAQFGAGSLAAAIAGWHLFGLLVCAAARAHPTRRSLPPLLRLSPAWVRRVAGIACSASIVLTPVAAHAAPSTDDRGPHRRRRALRARARVHRAVPDGRGAGAGSPTGTGARTASFAPAPAPTPAPADARTHVVVPGDNLWRIAAAELARVTGDAHPADRAIVTYWRALMDANRVFAALRRSELDLPGRDRRPPHALNGTHPRRGCT